MQHGGLDSLGLQWSLVVAPMLGSHPLALPFCGREHGTWLVRRDPKALLTQEQGHHKTRHRFTGASAHCGQRSCLEQDPVVPKPRLGLQHDLDGAQ